MDNGAALSDVTLSCDGDSDNMLMGPAGKNKDPNVPNLTRISSTDFLSAWSLSGFSP